jgi:hypothetical protein
MALITGQEYSRKFCEKVGPEIPFFLRTGRPVTRRQEKRLVEHVGRLASITTAS